MDTRRTTTHAGFTMVELLMTIAVASIVAMIAIPSFRFVTNSNRVAGEVNGLLGDLQFARAEAIKEGWNITVCTSALGASCDGTTTWQSGWIVYSNPTGTTIPTAGSILRIQSPFSGNDDFLASQGVSTITFNREGYAAGIPAGTVVTLHANSTPSANWTRCVSVNFSGMSFTLKYDGATCN